MKSYVTIDLHKMKSYGMYSSLGHFNKLKSPYNSCYINICYKQNNAWNKWTDLR